MYRQEPQPEVELFGADFADAYPHFRVHDEELAECLTWDPFVQMMLVWCMLCFGLRSAPLIWSRFAAALARLLAGMLQPDEGRLQLYLDDPFLGTLWIQGAPVLPDLDASLHYCRSWSASCVAEVYPRPHPRMDWCLPDVICFDLRQGGDCNSA